ncbi:MAG: hypothetical protein LAN71_08635 [Acidobacteriia bacterium]|nr:hypothetical protein [Terriglobia bacterium]
MKIIARIVASQAVALLLGLEVFAQTPAAPPPLAPCLIVTSAEGHRARNAILLGVFTGGIGLAAGAIASGGRYEYRDSINLPPSDVKMKYKGDEVIKIQKRGIHVVVVRKNDKAGEAAAIKDARASCVDVPAPVAAITPQTQPQMQVQSQAQPQPVNGQPVLQTASATPAPAANQTPQLVVIQGDESLGDVARRTKLAKQHSDCLKLAADNPSIACK